MGNAKLSIDFNDAEQLKKELADIEDIKKVIEEKLAGTTKPKRQISEGLADICEYVDEYIRLRKVPKQKIDKAILTIYCYGPGGASLDEIQQTSGIHNPSKNVINSGDNAKYFMSLKDSRYGLSALGLDNVATILTDLRKVPESESQGKIA